MRKDKRKFKTFNLTNLITLTIIVYIAHKKSYARERFYLAILIYQRKILR